MKKHPSWMKTVSGRLAFEIALHMWLGSLGLIVGGACHGCAGLYLFPVHDQKYGDSCGCGTQSGGRKRKV